METVSDQSAVTTTNNDDISTTSTTVATLKNIDTSNIKPYEFKRPPTIKDDSSMIQSKLLRRGAPVSSISVTTTNGNMSGSKVSLHSNNRDSKVEKNESMATFESNQTEHSTTAESLENAPSEEDLELLRRLELENQTIEVSQTTRSPSISSADSVSVSAKDGGGVLVISTSNEGLASPSNGPTSPVSATLADSQEDWDFWGKLIQDAETGLKRNQKMLLKAVYHGIPSSLRGTVWSIFSKYHPLSFRKLSEPPFSLPEAFKNIELEDAYVELLKITSPYEKMIMRDLARTFPKHTYFQASLGQESLFNVMKCYSLYDPEVGYCQGLSFVTGALLLHMPDEQAFKCMCHLMHTYGLRKMYTPGMELLQLRLWQFDKCLLEYMPKLHAHFEEEGIRSTMYASQWFLTLFSYRFPLDFVFRLLDLIFACGVVSGISGSGLMESVFDKVSEVTSTATSTQKMNEFGSDVAVILIKFGLTLLKKNEDTILSLDFEPLLEFLKNGLFYIYTDSADFATKNDVPKKAIDELVKEAMGQWRTVTKKKLVQLKKDYDEEMKAFDPNTMEEKTLSAQNQRLQQELRRAEKQLQELNKDHCDLAGQLVTVRVELQKQKDVSEALRRQVLDFKSILGRDIKTFNADSLNAVLHHEVTEANSLEPLPQPEENPDARIPSVEEQVAILTNQNISLMEESQLWRRNL
ncbi:hypothetical protein MP638_002308 [Amoeboaphelidium occidentale]|nr:hypothetical protein MP638_002308 [Amoeboaphelidium occidentale]